MLRHVHQAMHDLSERGTTLGHVVEAGVDMCAHDEIDIQAVEEPANVSLPVNAHVVAKAIPNKVRHVVDEREEPKNKPVSQVKAMCFEWIQPIRRVNNDASTWARASHCLPDRFPIIGDVLDDFVEENDVEAFILKGQAFRLGEGQARQVIVRLLHPVLLNVDSEYAIRKSMEGADPGAHAASDIENRLVFEGNVPTKEIETPVLTAPPYIAGVAAKNKSGRGGQCGQGRPPILGWGQSPKPPGEARQFRLAWTGWYADEVRIKFRLNVSKAMVLYGEHS